MRILAIDASSKSTGIAIFDDTKLIHYECISIISPNSLERIKKMAEKIEKIYQQYQPTNIVMEEVLPQDVKHNQTVYKVLIYLQAAVVLKMHQHNITVNLIPVNHWRAVCKIKTGPGIKRDTLKKASQKLIKDTYNIDVNDDISDAICIGLAYARQHCSAF